MSFANQVFCVQYIAENKLPNGIHKVSQAFDTYVAKIKLESMSITIDEPK